MPSTKENLSSDINLAIGGHPDIRIFRNNTGMGWVGKIKCKTRDTLTLSNPRPLHAGLMVGSADKIGIKRVKITSEMVGQTVGVFVSIEEKQGRDTVKAEQIQWLKMMQEFGAIAGVVRSPDEAKRLVGIA